MRARALLLLSALATIHSGVFWLVRLVRHSDPIRLRPRMPKRPSIHLNHGDLKATFSSSTPARTVTSGAVGPLQAPYKVCTTSTAEGHIVSYARNDRIDEARNQLHRPWIRNVPGRVL